MLDRRSARYVAICGFLIWLLAACGGSSLPRAPSPTTLPTAASVTAVGPTPSPLTSDQPTPFSPTATLLATDRPAATQTLAVSPTPVDVSGIALPTPTPLPAQGPFGIEVAPGFRVDHLVRPALLMPSDVKVSLEGRVFFTEWEGDRILELDDDGSISTFIELTPPVNSLLINSLNELFVLQGNEIRRISPTGEIVTFARLDPAEGIGGWTIDSQDSIYTVVGRDQAWNLVRFSPDGGSTIIASDVESGGLAVGPAGEIYIGGNTGRLLRVDPDGKIGALADGFAHESFNIGTDGRGNLYQNQMYFTQVSLEDGALSAPILREYNNLIVSRPFAFTPSGDVVFIGPTTNTAFRASLVDETMSVISEGTGNSYGLAVGPSGDVFLGASNEFPLMPGRVLSISTGGDIGTYATGFYSIRDVISDDVGNLYISDIDHEGGGGGRLIRISPAGEGTLISHSYHDLSSIVYVPALREIWGFEQNTSQMLSISEQGEESILPLDFGGRARTIDVALDGIGNVIALVAFEENYDVGPVHRGLYRVSPNQQITHLVDIDTPLCGSEDDVFVSPSGDIYVVGPEEHPVFRMLRITPDGEASSFARHLPYDTLGLTISDTGDIYFTCSAGLFRISRVD